MALPNVRNILRIGSPSSSYKLLLVAASFSRPKFRNLCLKLLQPFIRDGELPIHYRCYDRFYETLLRISELESDFLSTRELSIADTYRLDRGFNPDLVIDGGGNIGLFTLRAAAGVASSGQAAARFVICEPVPENIAQIQKHLDRNRVHAEILPVCLGGTRRTIPFFRREANQSSFSPSKPYTGVTDMPVYLLSDAIGTAPAQRILIKLDIEGMEIEALSTFLPSEQRPVYLVGELHSFSVNAPLMERLFQENGWTLEFFETHDDLSSFRACSPSAQPLLPSFPSVHGQPPPADKLTPDHHV